MSRAVAIQMDPIEGIDITGDSTFALALEAQLVLMRQDPPFDMAYITATHLLEHVHPARWW
jgi:glutathione synthase